MEKSCFGILQIVPRNLKISVESRFINAVLRSSLEFVPDIFWAELVYDLIGHNGTIKYEQLVCMKEIIWPHVFNPGRFGHGDSFVLMTLKGFFF